MIYFTADTHFDHANIIKYCNRPFGTVEEMNEIIIKNWNEVVKKGDIVYHLGDLTIRQDKQDRMHELLDALNGQIFLIKGNHDQTKQIDKSLRDRFIAIKDIHKVKIKIKDDGIDDEQSQSIILCHYAMRSWDGQFHGSWHLYGHSHGTLKEEPGSMSFDAGVDCHNFYPISYNEVKVKMHHKMVKDS